MTEKNGLIIVGAATLALLALSKSATAVTWINGVLGARKIAKQAEEIGFYDMSLGWLENPAQTRIEV